MVESCQEKCRDYGIKVSSITCDRPVVNESMLKKLGVSLDPDNINLEIATHIGNPASKALLDTCHMLKNVRYKFIF